MSLAHRALGSTSPNPAVGAVLVKDGEVVAEGVTQAAGGDHAEVVALKQAGEKAKGATLYVTLEPCNHYGRTPPCTSAIIDAGVSEVDIAIRDPNPSVDGGGVERLASQNIQTYLGKEAAAVQRQLEAWLKFVTTGKPFVTAKFAMSLDGKIATRSGDSKWISGDKARWYVHEMRARTDAMMVGIGTVIADDPQLTARDERGDPRERQPLRVVVDSDRRTAPSARLLSEPGKTLIATYSNTDLLEIPNNRDTVEARAFPAQSGKVDLTALTEFLAKERGVTSIMVEGGGTLLGSLFDLELIDKVVAFIAPTIIGGMLAPSPVGGLGAETMTEALELQNVRWKRLGRDMAIIGYC
jgi:diaminohydroxyphosphoribosylaminopyrimidine deaminase/5-amino-6-(5-phosphoribosylamino)uracil reductase